MTGEIFTNVEYAEYVEYGTIRMPPQSYMRRGMDEKKNEAQEAAVKELRESIRGWGAHWTETEFNNVFQSIERKIVAKAVLVIEGQVLTLVPVDTGRLRGSISHRVF